MVFKSSAGISEGWAVTAFKLGAKRSSSDAQLASREAGATKRLGARGRQIADGVRAAAPGTEWACPGPCHRPSTPPGQAARADTATARPLADRGAAPPSAPG